MISQHINIYGYQIATISIILLLAAIVSLFVYWYETRRDGFDEERALDLFLISLFSGVVLGRFTFGVLESFPIRDLLMHILRFWTSGFDAIGLFIGLVFPVFLFTRSWKWSVYRMTDIFVISLSFGSVPLLIGLFLLTNFRVYAVAAVIYLVLSFILYKMRLKVRSGLIFSLFLGFNALLGPFIFRTPIYLIFYWCLITMSLVNLYLREKKNPMKANLSANFITRMKEFLTSKEKELSVEQQLLMEEDPYMEEGRDADNADYLDDALEDTMKELHENRLSGVQRALTKVRKALGRINTKTYGMCEVCGEAIGKNRLEAMPEATTCLKCASKDK